MDLHNATSDVKNTGGTLPTPPYAGLTPCVLPEADTLNVESSHTGVSTDNVPTGNKDLKARVFKIGFYTETFFSMQQQVF